VEGHRSYSESGYPDQGYSDAGYTEGGAWQGDRGYTGDRGYGEHTRYAPAGEYPVAEPRRPEPDPAPLPTSGAGRTGTIGPRSGLPIPEEPPRRQPVATAPPLASAAASGAAPGSPGPAGGTYRSKRPGAAALFGVVAGVLEIPALALLREATFGAGPVSAPGVVSASCLVAALPLLAVGLYAVATGAVRAAGPNSAQAWLRPPVAYLSVGLVLLIAAGLAA
jgi:hypothetical protein